jgi:DNA relaxase NicK
MMKSDIKIDQIRLNIPYENLNMEKFLNNEIPEEVIVIDRIFHFLKIFDTYSQSYGHNGYTDSFEFGGENGKISVMYNRNRKDMGILIDFTATGKSLYENLAQLYGIKIDWKALITSVCNQYSGHVSRIDIATDLIDYGFSVNTISQSLQQGKYVFLNMIGNRIDRKRYKAIGDMDNVQTLYVGSRKSDAFLRIYDKKVEQLRADGMYRSIALSCNDWIRVEAEFKHRLAKKIGQLITNYEGDNIYPYLLSCVLERWSLVIEEKEINAK